MADLEAGQTEDLRNREEVIDKLYLWPWGQRREGKSPKTCRLGRKSSRQAMVGDQGQFPDSGMKFPGPEAEAWKRITRRPAGAACRSFRCRMAAFGDQQ